MLWCRFYLLNEGEDCSAFVWIIEEILLLQWAMAATDSMEDREMSLPRVCSLMCNTCVWKHVWSQVSAVTLVETEKDDLVHLCRS